LTERENGEPGAIGNEIVALVKVHSDEIEDAIVARIHSIGESSPTDSVLTAEFLAGLRPAAIEAVSSMASAFEGREEWSPVVTPAIAAQVHRLARQGTPLETLLSGLIIVGSVFFELIAEKFGDASRSEEALRYLVDWQRRFGDPFVNALVAEYTKEVERLDRAPSRRLAERVQGLLTGGSEADADLGYRLDACHVGAIAIGARAELSCRRLAERLGCDLLTLPADEGTVWAWFGSPRPIELARLERLVGESESLSVAAGEPREGLDGWRLSHREAKATLPVALLEPPGLTRYSDVALVADALRNEATCRSLIGRYVEPWDERPNGEQLRRTMRAYLDLDCNAASTASALGVNRHTVQRRLKRVEEAIGEPLSARRAELDVALRLERLTARASGQPAPHGKG
jgi:hypothetical protein